MNDIETNWLDRVPTQPGRFKVTHSGGTEEYVTVERADAPTEVGTAINRANLSMKLGEVRTFTQDNLQDDKYLKCDGRIVEQNQYDTFVEKLFKIHPNTEYEFQNTIRTELLFHAWGKLFMLAGGEITSSTPLKVSSDYGETWQDYLTTPSTTVYFYKNILFRGNLENTGGTGRHIYYQTEFNGEWHDIIVTGLSTSSKYHILGYNTNYVFFCQTTGGGIYKVAWSGGTAQYLNKSIYVQFNNRHDYNVGFQGEFIYLLAPKSNGGSLYLIKLDGTNYEEIATGNAINVLTINDVYCGYSLTDNRYRRYHQIDKYLYGGNNIVYWKGNIENSIFYNTNSYYYGGNVIVYGLNADYYVAGGILILEGNRILSHDVATLTLYLSKYEVPKSEGLYTQYIKVQY